MALPPVAPVLSQMIEVMIHEVMIHEVMIHEVT